MTVTTSLAEAFSFTFNAPSKTEILPCNGDLSNQQIGSIVSALVWYAGSKYNVPRQANRSAPAWVNFT
jgi:hypothetical protein